MIGRREILDEERRDTARPAVDGNPCAGRIGHDGQPSGPLAARGEVEVLRQLRPRHGRELHRAFDSGATNRHLMRTGIDADRERCFSARRVVNQNVGALRLGLHGERRGDGRRGARRHEPGPDGEKRRDGAQDGDRHDEGGGS